MKYIIELETNKEFNEFTCNQNLSDNDYSSCKEKNVLFIVIVQILMRVDVLWNMEILK